MSLTKTYLCAYNPPWHLLPEEVLHSSLGKHAVRRGLGLHADLAGVDPSLEGALEEEGLASRHLHGEVNDFLPLRVRNGTAGDEEDVICGKFGLDLFDADRRRRKVRHGGVQLLAVFDGLPRLDEGSAIERAIVGEDGLCLLYTSPSPRDRTRSRMPSSA